MKKRMLFFLNTTDLGILTKGSILLSSLMFL